jgi:hypothetical protein
MTLDQFWTLIERVHLASQGDMEILRAKGPASYQMAWVLAGERNSATPLDV